MVGIATVLLGYFDRASLYLFALSPDYSDKTFADGNVALCCITQLFGQTSQMFRQACYPVREWPQLVIPTLSVTLPWQPFHPPPLRTRDVTGISAQQDCLQISIHSNETKCMQSSSVALFLRAV